MISGDGRTMTGIVLIAYTMYSMNFNYSRASELIIPYLRIDVEKNGFYSKLKKFENYIQELRRNSVFMKKKNEIERIKINKEKSFKKTIDFQESISKLNEEINKIEEIIQSDEEDIQSFTFNIPDYIPEPNIEKKKKYQIYGMTLSSLLERDLEYLPAKIEKYISNVEEFVKKEKKFDFYYGVSEVDIEFHEWIESINRGEDPDLPSPCCYLELIKIFILKRVEPIFTYTYLPRFTSANSISNEAEKIFVLQELILDLPSQNSLIIYRLVQMFQILIGYGNIDPNQISNEFSNGMINRNVPLYLNFTWNQSSSPPLNIYQSENSMSPNSNSILKTTMMNRSPRSPKEFFNSVSEDDGSTLRQLLSNAAIKSTWLFLIKYFNQLFENENFTQKKNEFFKEMENEKRRRKEKEEEKNQKHSSIDITPSSYYVSCLKVGNLSPLFVEENLKKQRKFISIDTEDNVLKIEESGKFIIKGGTFEKLVQKLTHPYDNLDDSDIYVFLLTFRTFTDPITLFDALICRYNTPPPKQNITTERFTHFYQTYLKLIRLRVCQIVYHWISKHYYDFNDDFLLNEKLKKFLIELSRTKMESPLKKIENLVKSKRKPSTLISSISKEDFILQEHHSMFLSDISPKDFNQRFLDQNNKKIAQQLTLISFDAYKNIQPKEFLDKNWSNNKNKDQKAPNILKMTQRNDKISLWMASLIVLEPRIEIRSKLITKFIQIADILLSYQNFDGLMQITAGLNNTPVFRLHRSWSLVDQKTLTKWKDISTLLENKSNFKKMRDLLKNSDPPCKQYSNSHLTGIPFLGIFLTDLTFIDDGNKDMIEGRDGMINFQKRRLYALSIKKLISFQQTSYSFIEDFALKKYLCDLPNVDESFDYQKKSLEIEPRAKSTIK